MTSILVASTSTQEEQDVFWSLKVMDVSKTIFQAGKSWKSSAK